MLRKVFGPNRYEVAGERGSYIRRSSMICTAHHWVRHVAHTGVRRCSYRVLVGRPEGKKPLVRPRHRWEDNIKKDLQEMGSESINWIDLEGPGSMRL
jgi:hypothetical protein